VAAERLVSEAEVRQRLLPSIAVRAHRGTDIGAALGVADGPAQIDDEPRWIWRGVRRRPGRRCDRSAPMPALGRDQAHLAEDGATQPPGNAGYRGLRLRHESRLDKGTTNASALGLTKS
jgi:hypothetical protein